MQKIKQSVLDIVGARYEILEIIDLAQYWAQLDKLDQLLSKFNDYTFLNNQRIVILHHDTDYYVSNNSQGFTVFNLCTLLNRYQIPHEFLIMFTNHYGIEDEIAQISSQVCNCRSFKIIYTSQWHDYPDSNSFNDSQAVPIKNLFCCLNGVNRAHRLLTLCYLKKNNLFNLGTISYHFNQ